MYVLKSIKFVAYLFIYFRVSSKEFFSFLKFEEVYKIISFFLHGLCFMCDKKCLSNSLPTPSCAFTVKCS